MKHLLFVSCHKRQLETIVQEFEDRKRQTGIELDILLYGLTQKSNDGFLLLEVKKPLPEGVYLSLVQDDDILDYVLCPLAPPTITSPAS